MRILLATGIFYPELGGPATYTPRIAEEFLRLGHTASVITYSDTDIHERDVAYPFLVRRIKRGYKIGNYLRYFFSLAFLARRHDIIYAMDHMSAGIPAVLVGILLRKPVVIRVGGDFIWERYLRISGQGISLRSYYEQGLYKKDWVRFFIITFVFRFATRVIFTTAFQSTLFQRFYGIPKERISLVPNPLPDTVQHTAVPRYSGDKKEIVFAGRLNAKNNVLALLDAFLALPSSNMTLVYIGDGELKESLMLRVQQGGYTNVMFEPPVDRAILWERMAHAYGVVFPSFTDISPNTMLDALLVRVPFITSSEIGYEWVREHVHLFDPTSQDSIIDALQWFISDTGRKESLAALDRISYTYSFADAATETSTLFDKVV